MDNEPRQKRKRTVAMIGLFAMLGLLVVFVLVVIGALLSLGSYGPASNVANANSIHSNQTPSASATPITIPKSPTPQINANASPSSTPQGSDKWEAMRNTLETELRQGGRLAFDPPESMLQGSTATVTARISPQEVGEVLTRGFRNPDQPADPIQVAQTMKVILFSDDGAFTIVTKSSEEQVLVSPYTQWEWYVKAEQSGRHKLRLKVVATIKTLDRGEKPLDVTVADKEIAVDVSYKYIIGSFVSNSENWKYLIGSTTLLAVLGGAIRWLQQKFKKKPAPSSDYLDGD